MLTKLLISKANLNLRSLRLNRALSLIKFNKVISIKMMT